MYNYHQSLAISQNENRQDLKLLPILYKHTLKCVFDNGSKKEFTFELPSEEEITFGKREEWWASNIRSVNQNNKALIYLHSIPETFVYGKLRSKTTHVPDLILGGKRIQILF